MLQIGITGMGRNGFMNHIMESEIEVNKLIRATEELYNAGCPFYAVLNEACKSTQVSLNNLTDTDKQKLNRKIEEIYRIRG